jgi:hypothetical protein
MPVLDLSMYSGFHDPTELMMESQTGLVFPLVMVADLANGNMGASKTQGSGSGNCYAHTRFILTRYKKKKEEKNDEQDKLRTQSVNSQ